jgi:hypothetical protein
VKASEVEASFIRDVGVGIESDVGDGVALPYEEAASLEVPLHDAKSVVTESALLLQRSLTLIGHLDAVRDPGPYHGDVWLVVVLLEEHPLQ